MVKSCSVLGCKQRYSKESGVSFHRFPAEAELKERWVTALARHNWQPSNYSLVCGKHFLTGRPSADPKHPDFIPNMFPHISMHHQYRTSYAKRVLLMSYMACDQSSRFLDNQATASQAESGGENSNETSQSQDKGFKRSAMDNKQGSRKKKKKEVLMPRRFIPSGRKASTAQVIYDNQQQPLLAATANDESDAQHSGELSEQESQLLLMQRLSEQNAQLQEEMRTQLKKQQSEINLLQVQVEMLKEKNSKLCKEPKHTPRDVMSEAFLVDKNRCMFYTGIPNNESFLWLLEVLENQIQKGPVKISTSKQLLAVLMKLKFDFQHVDLGYRFGVASSTICRILKIWIPSLIKTLTEFVRHSDQEKAAVLEPLLGHGSNDTYREEHKLWPDKILARAMSYKSKTPDESKETEEDCS